MKKSNISFSDTSDSKIKSCDILIEGEASIKIEQEVYHEFINYLNDFDILRIILKNIELIDLPFIQLLISLQQTSKLKNKKISFNIELPENLQTILINSGFDVKKLFML